MREMESFASCDFFIVPGNHDPYDAGSPYALLSWPKNVHIFTEEQPAYFDLPEKNARIYGHAYREKEIPGDLFSGFHVEDETKINILLAHGFVNMPQSACNVLMKKDIEQSGLDYVALGHIHTHGGFEKAGKTVYAYSGCAVGRSFDECGYKYAVAGTIAKEGTEGKLNLSALRCCDRRFEILRVDLSGVRTPEEAKARLREQAGSYGEDTALRVIADGAVAPDAALTFEEVRLTLRAPFYVEWMDHTVPVLDTDRLKNDVTVLGAFYRQMEGQLLSDNPEERQRAALALRYGLAALCGRELSSGQS